MRGSGRKSAMGIGFVLFVLILWWALVHVGMLPAPF